jgi:hypothetical protein
VYNGSYTEELETAASDYLRAHGVNVAESSPGGERYTATTVVDNSGNPYLLRYLVDLYGIPPERIIIQSDPAASVDVELYLGDNAVSLSLP